MRLEFDMTVDEAVDTGRRAMQRSNTFLSIRRRSIWASALMPGPALVATWILRVGSPSSPTGWAVLLGLAVITSTFGYGFGRWYYDSTVSRRIRRMVLEQFGKAASVPCEVEVRTTALWTRQDGTEITLPWTDLEAVVDTDDAIELRFRNGLCIARNRVFSSPAQRAEFLASVSSYVSLTSTSPAAS